MKARQQNTETDCAAACLVYVAEHYRLQVSSAVARSLSGTTRSGTSVLGLVEAARSLKFSARAVRANRDALESFPAYSIAHLGGSLEGRGHFVVFLGVQKDLVRIMDPSKGRVVELDLKDFCDSWTGVMVLLGPSAGFDAGLRTRSPIARVFGLLRGSEILVVQMALGAICAASIGLAMSFYFQTIIDRVIPEENTRFLALASAGIVLALLVRTALGWFQYYYSAKLAQRIDAALILGYYRHLFRLPQSFYDSMKTGEMMSRIGDALQIRSFLGSLIVTMIINPLVVVVATVAMFSYSWRLALIALCQLPLHALTYWYVNRINRKYQRAIRERQAQVNAHVVESLRAISTIKKYSAEAGAIEVVERSFVRLLRMLWSVGRENYLATAFANGWSQMLSVALMWTGASLVIGGKLTLGQMMSAYTMAAYSLSSLGALVGVACDLQQTLISCDRLFEITDLPCENEEGSARALPDVGLAIAVESLTMHHTGRLPFVENLSFKAEPGQITLIAGESGCGKSSIFAAILKTYPIQSGRILIGTVDADYLALGDLRRTISLLPQRIDLFSGTLLGNLALGSPEPDLERALSVCRDLGFMGFVDRLPQKLGTVLGEGGAGLSGGQRQKLAIARTFYRDSPIYLLDEPTTGLDRESVAKLVGFLQRLRSKGKTIVVATHHRALAGAADGVIEFGRFRANKARIDEPPSVYAPPLIAEIST